MWMTSSPSRDIRIAGRSARSRLHTSFLADVQARSFDLAIQLHGSGQITNPLIALFGAKRPARFFVRRHWCPNPNPFCVYLMELFPARVEKKLLRVEEQLRAVGAKQAIAITEGHPSLAPTNINPLLSKWLTGVYHARVLNLYQRHGDRVKICTAADFSGTRWTTNALMLTMPQGPCYLLPAGTVMRLFKRYNGKQAVAVRKAPTNLDIAASRTGGTLFLHIANMEYSRSVAAQFLVDGMRIEGGRIARSCT
jgi:hypothetical protein